MRLMVRGPRLPSVGVRCGGVRGRRGDRPEINVLFLVPDGVRERG